MDVPKNEIKTKTVTMYRSVLYEFSDELLQDPNVISIEHRRDGSKIEVTVHYSVMDLASQLAVINARIEDRASELNKQANSL